MYYVDVIVYDDEVGIWIGKDCFKVFLMIGDFFICVWYEIVV